MVSQVFDGGGPLPVSISITRGGAVLQHEEIRLLDAGLKRHGRATLLVPTFAERDACRRALADAGTGLGFDVADPASWLADLWLLLGDGRSMIAPLERRMLMEAVFDALDPDDIAPLRANPGTVRLLCEMASDLLSYADDIARTGTEGVLARLLGAYAKMLQQRSLIEPCQAAEELRSLMGSTSDIKSLGFVCLRDVDRVPAYLYRLLAGIATRGGAEVLWLLDEHQAPFAENIAGAFEGLGCEVAVSAPLSRMVSEGRAGDAAAASGASDAPIAGIPDFGRGPDELPRPVFLEVAGPHARARAYADAVVRLVSGSACDGASQSDRDGVAAVSALGLPGSPASQPDVVVVSPRPAELLQELASRFAVHGIEGTARLSERFDQTLTGRQFNALSDLAARLDAVESGEAEPTLWWPAPELADWLLSPLSGATAIEARRFDRKLRSMRCLSPEDVIRQLQSVQGRVDAARRRAAQERGAAPVPCVCSDVLVFLRSGRPVSALKAMLSVVDASSATAFGSSDGLLRQQVERAGLIKAIEAVGTLAHRLDVSQQVAVRALDGLLVSASMLAGAPAGSAAACPRVKLLSLADAALLPPASCAGVFCADVDVESYPLSHEEGPHAALAQALHREPLVMEPVALSRSRFSHLFAASRAPLTLARVSHDRQAKDRYPAAMWTEYKAPLDAQAKDASRAAGKSDDEVDKAAYPVLAEDEGEVVRDFDPAGARGLQKERVACLPPQALSKVAVRYVELKKLAQADATADSACAGVDAAAADDLAAAGDAATAAAGRPLVLRPFSASQIESYLTCPLCWFISSRVRPQEIDAGFGNMEKGNFVHDVLYQLHSVLPERGFKRVTRENVDACIDVLREVFEEVRLAHEQGKTSTSAALVPHSAAERLEVDRILPQLEGVLRYEAAALSAFAPAYLEYSFDGLDIDYAGRPLGGRIDRVDVDAEGHCVVIDYKHRSEVNQFKAQDPTVPDKKTGAVAADDPDWLPQHTQALIYAQALRRSGLGLDPRGAVYFSTKGTSPAMRGAVSVELAQVEPDDGRVPGLKTGFPDEEAGGTMDFYALLDHVEDVVRRRLDALEAGDVRAASEPGGSCERNHDMGFTRRDA